MDAEIIKIQNEFETKFNEIFKGLKEFGDKIIIVYETIQEDITEPFKYEIISINGGKGVNGFTSILGIIKDKIVSDLKSVTILSISKEAFLNYILKNIKCFIIEYIILSDDKEKKFSAFKKYTLKDSFDGEILDLNNRENYSTIEEINSNNHFQMQLILYTREWYKMIISLELQIATLLKETIELENELTYKNSNKLKVKLSVAQLTYLFKILEEHKLIDANHNTDIFKFIADSFQTKGKKDKEEQSNKSIKNDFDNPEMKTIVFWDEKFEEFKKYTSKMKG